MAFIDSDTANIITTTVIIQFTLPYSEENVLHLALSPEWAQSASPSAVSLTHLHLDSFTIANPVSPREHKTHQPWSQILNQENP